MSEHNCDCGCDCHDEEILRLPEDDGTEKEYVIIASFTIEEQEYYACVPVEGEEVRFLSVMPISDDEVELSDIESEKEFELVCDTFEELLDDAEFDEDEDEE